MEGLLSMGPTPSSLLLGGALLLHCTRLHSGPTCLHNFPRLKNLTVAPRLLGISSQPQKCDEIASFHPIVFPSELEIEFYPIFTSLGLLESKINPK